MEFQISDIMKVSLNFDHMDFLQFSWIHNRAIRSVNERNNAITNIGQLVGK